MQTLEADIDERGMVHLHESVVLPVPRRALITILDEEPRPMPNQQARREQTLRSKGWDNLSDIHNAVVIQRSPEELAAALQELVQVHDAGAPVDRRPLSDDAVNRTGIYADED